MDFDMQAQVDALQAHWSGEGQRVLALCRRRLTDAPLKEEFFRINPNDAEELIYSEMTSLAFVGLVGIRDPPRPDVKDAMAIIRRAGVRVFMVTGDFKLTALAIARQVSRRDCTFAVVR